MSEMNVKKFYKLQVTKDQEKVASNVQRRKAAKYAQYYNECKVQENCILYEAFYGRGILCNVHGLFTAFSRRDDFQQYTHLWVIDDFSENEGILEELKKYSNVKFILFQSDEYYKALATAKYLVNNSTFPTVFTKKKEQIYINPWHGIPLKNMGYDEVGGNNSVANTIRNFVMADYIIAPCA